MRIIQDLIENPAPAAQTVSVPTLTATYAIVNRYRELLVAQANAQNYYNYLANILNNVTTAGVCNQIGLRELQTHTPADAYDMLGALGLAYAVDNNKTAILAALTAYMVTPRNTDVTNFQNAYTTTLHAAGFAF